MMTTLLEELVRGFFSQGNFGVLALITVFALLAAYFTSYLHSRSQLRLLEECLDEQKTDKQCILDTLANNTTALIKNISAIEKCTQAVTQNTQLIQNTLMSHVHFK